MWRSCALVVAGVVASTACSFKPPGESADPPADSAAISGDGSVPIDAPIQVELVQTATAIAQPWNSSSRTLVATFVHPLVRGHVVALYATFEASTSVQVISDDADDAFTIVDSLTDSGDNQRSSIGYAVIDHDGATTVTLMLAGSTCCRQILAHELANVNTTMPLVAFSGQHQSSPGTGANAVATTVMTIHEPDVYVFAATSNTNNVSSQTIASGTDAMLQAQLAMPNANHAATEDKRAQAGDITSAFTFTKNGDALTSQMAFRPAR